MSIKRLKQKYVIKEGYQVLINRVNSFQVGVLIHPQMSIKRLKQKYVIKEKQFCFF